MMKEKKEEKKIASDILLLPCFLLSETASWWPRTNVIVVQTTPILPKCSEHPVSNTDC